MHSPGLAKRVDVDDKVTVLHDADDCRRNSSGEKDEPDQNMTFQSELLISFSDHPISATKARTRERTR